jgi:hypothetical protein
LVIKGTNSGASSNTRGYYYIPAVTEGEKVLKVSYLGYKTTEIKYISVKGDR